MTSVARRGGVYPNSLHSGTGTGPEIREASWGTDSWAEHWGMIRHYLVERGKKERCRQKTAKTWFWEGVWWAWLDERARGKWARWYNAVHSLRGQTWALSLEQWESIEGMWYFVGSRKACGKLFPSLPYLSSTLASLSLLSAQTEVIQESNSVISLHQEISLWLLWHPYCPLQDAFSITCSEEHLEGSANTITAMLGQLQVWAALTRQTHEGKYHFIPKLSSVLETQTLR